MAETKTQAAARQKYNYQTYRSLGFSPREARKMRNRSPVRAAEDVIKAGGDPDPIPEELLTNKRIDSYRDLIKTELKIPKYITNKLDPGGLNNMTENMKKIKKLAGERGMKPAEVWKMVRGFLESKTEKGFWTAVRSMYDQAIGIRP